jgi:hypothetical protein
MIVLFEKHCHATEKSEAIAFPKRWRSSQLAGWWTKKKNHQKKMEGQGVGEAQGVADPQNIVCQMRCTFVINSFSNKSLLEQKVEVFKSFSTSSGRVHPRSKLRPDKRTGKDDQGLS